MDGATVIRRLGPCRFTVGMSPLHPAEGRGSLIRDDSRATVCEPVVTVLKRLRELGIQVVATARQELGGRTFRAGAETDAHAVRQRFRARLAP